MACQARGTFRPIVPEMLELESQLERWSITREGVIDLALLIGTDFNDGVNGIGPKKALKLVQQHGRIEDMPAEIRDAVGEWQRLGASICSRRWVFTRAW